MDEKRILIVVRSAVIATLFVGLWVWLALLVQRFDPMIGAAPPARLRPLGWVFLAAGAALGAACVWLFVTVGRGTPAPFDPPTVFVAIGPYRYVRNPMYISAVLSIAGGGLLARSFSILALAAVFGLLSHCMVLFYEEPALERRFGGSFTEYKRHVNRWWPRLPDHPR